MKSGEKRSQALPDMATAASTLNDAVHSDGALSKKIKRLIAIAVAFGLGCLPFIIAQTKQAVEVGAAKEEVLEAASVLMAIRDTSG